MNNEINIWLMARKKDVRTKDVLVGEIVYLNQAN
jgi:hypothetical protein